jgi:hypothetical protein
MRGTRLNHQPASFMRMAAAVALTALVAACGSNNVTTAPIIQSQAAFTTSTTSTSALPTLGTAGYTVTGTAPQATAAVTITESVGPGAPSGITPLSTRRTAAAATNTDLLYVTFSSTSTVTLAASPALTFTSSSITSGTAYSIGENVNGTWTAPFAGPQTASGNSVTFASVATPLTITPNAPVTFVLYTGSVATPTPSPSPSPSPSPTPTPVVSPATLVFDASAPTSHPFSVSETNYAGAFNATMTCTANPAVQTPPANAFVAQFSNGTTSASGTAASAGAAVAFTVASGAETGSCSVSVADASGHASGLAVTVSTTGVTIDATGRR